MKQNEQKPEGGLSSPPDRSATRDAEIPRGFFDPEGEVKITRNRLPHWQQNEAWAFVTWRLADSLPKTELDHWRNERDAWLAHHPKPWDAETETEYHERFSRQIDEWLDQGRGSCVLKDSANARIVADALAHFDGERCELGDFVVMPNHVHVLFRPLGGHALADVVRSWKGFTARAINKRMGARGAVWQDEYWDRLIRSERHFLRVAAYIRENPGKARLGVGEYLVMERGPWRGLASVS